MIGDTSIQTGESACTHWKSLLNSTQRLVLLQNLITIQLATNDPRIKDTKGGTNHQKKRHTGKINVSRTFSGFQLRTEGMIATESNLNHFGDDKRKKTSIGELVLTFQSLVASSIRFHHGRSADHGVPGVNLFLPVLRLLNRLLEKLQNLQEDLGKNCGRCR